MIVFCDGASNPKTKRSGVGVVWFDKSQFKDPRDGKTLQYGMIPKLKLSKEIFDSKTKYIYPTNNEAEYISLIMALEKSIDYGLEYVDIYMDSKLVVNQVNNKWKINFEHLQELKNKVDILRSKISSRVFHVRREYNTHADKESKRCLSRQPPNPFEEWKK